MDDPTVIDPTVIDRIVESIRPMLAGHPPQVQSAVIADLLAIFLAGHFAPTPVKTAAAREMMLGIILDLVRQLIPVNEATILAARGEG